MEDKLNHQIGISSWSYPWAVGVSKGPRLKRRLSVTSLIEKAISLDVKLVQIADNLPLENLPWETMVKLKRLAGDTGITLEAGTCGVNPGHLMKFLEIAEFLRSPILRTVPSAPGKHVNISDLEDNLNEVITEFEKADIKIVLENTVDYKTDELVRLMESINHPNLRISLDLVNAIGSLEGPESVMSKLGPWCGNFQFKDVVVVRSMTPMGFNVEGRPSGKGDIPIQWALDKLKEMGVHHPTIIELWPPWQGDIESTVKLEEDWVAESVAFMKSLY